MKTFKEFILESIIDIPRKTLSLGIFENDQEKLKPEVKEFIETGTKNFEKFAKIKKAHIIGSILTKRYRNDADIDVNLLFDTDDESVREKIIELVHKHNGKNVPGTQHPVNYYTIINTEQFENANNLSDGVFDLFANKFIKKSKETPFTIDEYLKTFNRIVKNVDLLKGELDRDLVDYEILNSLHKNDISALQSRIEEVITEIETTVNSLVDIYVSVTEDRRKIFSNELSAKEIAEYGTKHRLPKNVIYKLLEKYYYIEMMHQLKNIIGDDRKLSKSDVKKVITVAKRY